MKNIRVGALVLLVLSVTVSVTVFLSRPQVNKAHAPVASPAPASATVDREGIREMKTARRDAAKSRIIANDGTSVARLSMDEAAVILEDGKERIVTINPPATYSTLMERLKEIPAPYGVRPVAYQEGEEKNNSTRRIVTSDIRAKMPQQQAELIASKYGLKIKERPAYAPEWVVFSANQPMEALEKIEGLRDDSSVESADVLLAVLHTKKALPDDTLIGQQWHLKASGSALAGTDVNIENAWKYGGSGGMRGIGIRIAIVDDGLQVNHPDLITNVDTANDKDYNGGDNDPSPGSGDDHGTSCAGNAAARGNNALGVSGTAPEATLVGLRLIAASVNDSQEADAMAYLPDLIRIKSNSWGPSDTGRILEEPGDLTKAALMNTANQKNTIFVWAGGNGGDTTSKDNSNYDGYANSIYTIAVGATDSLGRRADYSEPGANLVVCAPSSGSGALGITTVDRTSTDGYNTASGTAGNYADDFGGTSSATPTAAGIIALMLQKNPNLGWRDVQEILIRTAKKIRPTDADWFNNAAGFHFNHDFGSGLIDADAAVNLSAGWTNLAAQTSAASAQTGLSVTIPNNNATGITRQFSIPTSNIRVEHATLKLNISHARRGELEISLTSPSGTVSRLAEVHGDTGANYSQWTFSTVRNWGELSSGTWTLKVADRSSTNSTAGTLTSATLTVFGAAAANVNPAPVVTITSPANGSTSSPNVPFTVSVSAQDFDVNGTASTVSQVRLLQNGQPVATKTLAPYDFTVTPPLGSNVFVAEATDIEGKIGTSAPITTTVLNRPPEIVSVTLNMTGQGFVDSQLQVASVSATDPEGTSLTTAYQWQSSTDGIAYSDSPGATSVSLPVSPANSGKMWRCFVTVSDGNSSASLESQPVNILDRPPVSTLAGNTYSYQSGLVLRGTQTEITRQAIINEFSQGPAGGSSEWIEFLVLQSGSLRYWDFQDAAGNIVVFQDTAVWDDIPAGTVIVVYNGSASKDLLLPPDSTDPSSGKMVISSTNTTYFDPGFNDWPPLGNSGDSIFLADADGNAIHQVSYGNSSAASPNVGTVNSGKAAYYTGDTDAGADVGGQWTVTSSTISRTVRDSKTTKSLSPGATFTAGVYSQDFNTTPGATGTAYPAGWTSYNQVGGTTNVDTMIVGNSTSSSGGNYNFGSKIGLLGSGGSFDPGFLALALDNTSGLSDLKISYSVTKITEQSRSMQLVLEYTDQFPFPTTWTPIFGGSHTSGSTPVGTVADFTNIALPAIFQNRSTPIYLRWAYSSTGTGARDALAIDNVQITSAASSGPSMSLSLNPTSVVENVGANASTGTISFTQPVSGDLTIQLSSSDISVATVPASVTISAGASSVTFPVATVNNSVADGTRTALINAIASGYSPANQTLTVTDDEASAEGITPGKGNNLLNQTFITALRNNTINTAPVFSLAPGSTLPNGLSLNTATGLISGTIAGNAASGNFPVTIQLTNSIGETVSQTFEISITSGAITFGSWIAGFTLADPSVTGDSDLDQLPNLIEYKLNSLPGTFEKPSPIILESSATEISIAYSVAENRDDVTLVAEWNTSLETTGWQTAGITNLTLEDLPERKTIKSSLPVVPGDPKRFLRLRATEVTSP